MPSGKKNFNYLCSGRRCIIVQKNYLIIKPIFYWWDEKIIKNFNVLIVEVMIAISPVFFFNDIQPLTMKDLKNLVIFFWQSPLFHLNNNTQKF